MLEQFQIKAGQRSAQTPVTGLGSGTVPKVLEATATSLAGDYGVYLVNAHSTKKEPAVAIKHILRPSSSCPVRGNILRPSSSCPVRSEIVGNKLSPGKWAECSDGSTEQTTDLLCAPHKPLHQSHQLSHLKEISSTSQGLLLDTLIGVVDCISSYISPYVFGVGLTTYLVSKEIYVLEHEYYTGISVAILCVLIVKKLGPPVAKYLDKEIDDIEAGWNQGREASIKDLEDSVENEKKEQWRAEGQNLLFEAKKENVSLQLEATYRERVAEVYNEVCTVLGFNLRQGHSVKRRLDYQVERLNVDRRIAHKHMVSWILSNVLKSITPQQEKESLQKCIADLKNLAAKA
uniref:ATP synthase subunit b n=1 Tax=Timema cristinae TaxID=61476 RepID=A0A7R9GUT3_TIMCR|nr:unnamed protein product [Timema cristinae]